MATYAIGDVQGCFDDLWSLLVKIDFKSDCDQLWFCGDLVNRGPKSLETLRFIRDLADNATTVLGNHDVGLMTRCRYACARCEVRRNTRDLIVLTRGRRQANERSPAIRESRSRYEVFVATNARMLLAPD